MPCDTAAHSRRLHKLAHMAEQPISLECADGAANADGGDLVGDVASSEKDAGSIIACMDGAKPLASKMVRFIIDNSKNRLFRTSLRSSSTRAFRAR